MNQLFIYVLSILITAGVYWVTHQRILLFIQTKEMRVINYSGRHIETGGGLLLLFPCMLAVFPMLLFEFHMDHLFYMFIVVALTLAGLMDDLLGDKTAKGLGGHLKRLLHGGFTTGAMKALTGGLIGILLAWSRYTTISVFFMDVINFSLSVNLMNLLDLRPGRSVKGFMLTALVMTLGAGFRGIWVLLPLLTALSLYLKGELEERYMLGDTGANLLGGILGLYAVIALPLQGKLILAAFLVFIHLAAEFYSLSRWIDSVPLLRRIDQLGRRNWR